MKLRVGATLEDINQLFDRFDRDKNGRLHLSELKEYISAEAAKASAAKSPPAPPAAEPPPPRGGQDDGRRLSELLRSLAVRRYLVADADAEKRARRASATVESARVPPPLKGGRPSSARAQRQGELPIKSAPGKVPRGTEPARGLEPAAVGQRRILRDGAPPCVEAAGAVVQLTARGGDACGRAAPCSPPASPPPPESRRGEMRTLRRRGAAGCRGLMSTCRRRQQLPAASVDVMAKFQREAAADLDKGTLWRFKFFVLFPILLHLRHLDHYSRVVFPIAYCACVAYFLGQIDRSAVDWPTDSPCV